MSTSIIVVIKYYMDCIIKYIPCHREWSDYINRSAFRNDDTNIYASNIQQMEHKYAGHYEILMKEAIIMYVTTYVGSK